MYPPFAGLFHDKSTGRALYYYPIGSGFKFRSSLNFQVLTVKPLYFTPKIISVFFIMFTNIEHRFPSSTGYHESHDDLLPVGLNLYNISLASQRSGMKFRFTLGLILSFYRYRCC